MRASLISKDFGILGEQYVDVRYEIEKDQTIIHKVFWDNLNITPWIGEDEFQKLSEECLELSKEDGVEQYVDEKKEEDAQAQNNH